MEDSMHKFKDKDASRVQELVFIFTKCFKTKL